MKILFVSFDNISGVLSKISTKSDWSHVDILFDDGTLIGATKEGVQKMTFRERLMGKRPIEKFRIDEIVLPYENRARDFAEAQVGKAYDWTAVAAFFIPMRVDWDDPNRWFCSELATAAIHEGGLQIARLVKGRISPGFLDSSPLLKTVRGPDIVYPGMSYRV